MSIRMFNKGSSPGKNENVQRKILSHHNAAQKYTVSHSASRPSPILSDKNEFPSLSENTERQPSNLSSSGGPLTYSDKLKLSSSSSSSPHSSSYLSQVPLSKNDRIGASSSGQVDTNVRTGMKPKKSFDKIKSGKDLNQNTNKKSLGDNFSSYEQRRHSVNKDFDCKTRKQINFNHTANYRDKSSKTSSLITGDTSSISNLNNQNQSNTVSKSTTEVNESKEEADNAKTKKKKKRKSKVKRQVALQTGKITVLPPEVHSKILNQTNTLTTHNLRNFLTDINDEEEYPELGKPFVPSKQKEISQKKENFECQKEIIIKPDIHCDSTDNIIEEKPEIISTSENTGIKGKNDSKEKVHSYDPIKISFYEMLLERNIKTKIKDTREEPEVAVPFETKKVIKTKKTLCNPVNLLDSSSPAIKRGKEREKPKPKKPSQLKKIILLDRKARKDHLLQFKANNEEEVADENGNKTKHVTDTDEDESDETCMQNSEDEDKNNMYDTSEFSVEDKSLLFLPENNDLNIIDDLHEINHLNIDEVQDAVDYVNDLSVSSNEINEVETCALNVSSKASSDERNSNTPQVKTKSISDVPLDVSNSPDSLWNGLMNDNNKSEASVKEKAAKILLHTRNFREYCNHLTSKDIDDAAYALLDDLARFQDRLHQRDPVKARMKKRMIYGVKEVKKHIKLRKLKCIIIAADIENVETQGGLNDVLNDIKTSAADHHIPCVFALGRKMLGKVCHKPVPVSCIGIFNYEGSEANFKKMVELQTQSKTDYMEIFNALSTRLTDKEAEALLRAKKEAPETLRGIRTDLLNNFFLESKTSNMENESAIIESVEQLSDVTAVES